jgi:DNA-binding MarR family transcriptional regulator
MSYKFDSLRLVAEVEAIARSRAGDDKHKYFCGVANARFVLRRVFRIVEEQAKLRGLESVQHQALLQIYGTPDCQLRVKDLANRLDVSQAFASSLTRALVDLGLVERVPSEVDLRSTLVTINQAGIQLVVEIDEAVKGHVDYFTAQLTPEQQAVTLYIMMFYVGVTVSNAGDGSGVDADQATPAG